VDSKKHITADILVKNAIEVPVNIKATIILDPNRQKNISQMDSDIRTSINRYFGALSLGQPVRQSDIVRTIDSVSGVSYVSTPLTTLTKAKGSLVPIEPIVVSQTSDYKKINSWSTNTVYTWLLLNPLTWDAQPYGGGPDSFHAVYRNKTYMDLSASYPNVNGYPLKLSSGRACIIGEGGLEIPGYNDTATLESIYTFNTDPNIRQKEMDLKKKELSQNRVLVTLSSDEDPSSIEWLVSYITESSTKTQNIEISEIEYLVVGSVDLSYDEDKVR
jgi:hypothetical protein